MIKFIIAMGAGFSPGSVKYFPTLGFSIGAVPTNDNMNSRLAVTLGVGM